MSAVRIVVFAKAPRPGFVKTRLVPALGANGAAKLAERMLHATLAAALDASVGPVELCMEPAPGAPAWESVPLPVAIEHSAQGAGDLGVRLARAARHALERGEHVILIGSDCVEMSAGVLRDAADSMTQHGAVICEAADGGYALLGLTRFAAELFSDMPWSTAEVAAETARRFESLGWPLHRGPTLRDVDRPEDLVHVPAEWLEDIARPPENLPRATQS